MLLILLTVGKSPKNVQKFTRISCGWEVVMTEPIGKKLLAEVWRGKPIVTAPASSRIR